MGFPSGPTQSEGQTETRVCRFEGLLKGRNIVFPIRRLLTAGGDTRVVDGVEEDGAVGTEAALLGAISGRLTVCLELFVVSDHRNGITSYYSGLKCSEGLSNNRAENRIKKHLFFTCRCMWAPRRGHRPCTLCYLDTCAL